MKNFLILFAICALILSSCKEEEYADWKIYNQIWLDRHKNDSAFHQTESGLCYKVIHQGYMTRPELNSKIKVKYKGTLIDGTVFDSSDSYTSYLGYMISGWQKGLARMNSGGHYIFYIPYTLGYGETGSGSKIPPYSTLIFDVELIEVDNPQ
jgi:FKBP-type peptidyl-prolyl cis-trans isomerase